MIETGRRHLKADTTGMDTPPHDSPQSPATTDDAARARIAALSCWRGPITVEPLPGGLTNRNHLVRDGARRFVVRLTADSPLHDIDRAAERAATQAAERAGLGPAVLHAEPGALVLAHIPGRTLTPADLAAPATLRAVIDLLRRVADAMPSLYVGAARDRRPAAVLAAYQTVIEAQASDPWRRRAARFAPAVEQLAALPEPPPAFVHGDIHAGNILDDGERFWLVDWEYAGLGVVGQDLASLVANGPATDPDRFAEAALVAWLGRPPGVEDLRALWHGLLGATLRDLFWGFAQASIDEELAASDYLSINERRVLTVLDHLYRV